MLKRSVRLALAAFLTAGALGTAPADRGVVFAADPPEQTPPERVPYVPPGAYNPDLNPENSPITPPLAADSMTPIEYVPAPPANPEESG